MNNFSIKFNKKKKLGLVILSAVVIGILFTISFQPAPNLMNSSLEENIGNIISPMGRVYGTINISSGSPILGSTDAPTTIIAFGDFQCASCKDWFLNTKPNITKNLIEPGKANLVFIDAELLGADSLLASEASYCAEEQDKYWEYHGILYSSQLKIDDGWASSASLKILASDLGLDESLFENCLNSGKYEKKVKFNAYEAKKNGISKTPTFIILDSKGKNHKIMGSAPYSLFEEIVDLFTQSK